MSLTIKAQTIGRALRHARQNSSILSDDVARMLKISREQLVLFENGEVEIPTHILNSIFSLGLMMMHTRSMMRNYSRMAKQWHKMYHRAIDLHEKLKKFTVTENPILDMDK